MAEQRHGSDRLGEELDQRTRAVLRSIGIAELQGQLNRLAQLCDGERRRGRRCGAVVDRSSADAVVDVYHVLSFMRLCYESNMVLNGVLQCAISALRCHRRGEAFACMPFVFVNSFMQMLLPYSAVP